MSNPIDGTMVYDTDSNCIRAYENGVWSICFSNGANGTSNGTAVITSCTLGSSTGSLTVGTDATGTVQQSITVTVGTVGTYSIVTNTVNGVIYAASGTFTATGSQTITLLASGTPTASGTHSFTPNTTTGCSFTKTIIDPSTNGTAVYTYSNCSYSSLGTMTAGNSVVDVSQTLQVNVSSIGTYSINSISNGVTFSASGTFTTTGLQTILLAATGTPVAVYNTLTYDLNTTPTCSFVRVVAVNPTSNGSAVITITGCASGAGTLATNNSASGVTQTIIISVTTPGTYAIATSTVNGITFSGSGTLIAGTASLLLTASGTPTAAGTSTFDLNTTSSCSFSRTIIEALPAGVTLSAISPYFFASVYDQDYLPYTAPTGVATLTTPQAANGTNEITTLDILGSISTTGVTIKIPYTATSSVALPAFTQTISIGAGYTNDNTSRSLTLSYSATSLSAGSGTISATLKAVDGTLNLKKLDIQTGIGSDNLGVLFGQFTYVTNSSGSTTTFDLRDIALIPDRNINAITNHVMFYAPVRSITGKVWLNNNLGAHYSNTANVAFSPLTQATNFYDYKAFGSLIQWGRNTDGHELIPWTAANTTSSTTGTLSQTTTTFSSLGNYSPNHAKFIYLLNYSNNLDWISPKNDSLWQGESGINNPCPTGYRIPTSTELLAEVTAYSITNTATAYSNSVQKFPAPGYRNDTDGLYLITGNLLGTRSGYYMSSTINSINNISQLFIYSTEAKIAGSSRATGVSVRCIKD
jgi:hypothetical protein